MKTKKKKYNFKKTSKNGGNNGENIGVNQYNKLKNDAGNVLNYIDERDKQLMQNTFNKISSKVVILFEELLVEYINVLGRLLGVDISNPQDINSKLEEIRVIVTDPEIREKVKIIVERMVIIMDIALDAMEPYSKPLGEKLSNIYVNIASEFDTSLVRITKDVIAAIPGLNVIAALVDVSSMVSTTMINVYNAKLKMQDAVANTVEASSINYNKLLKERGELLNRTNESINQFSQGPVSKSI